MTAKPNVLLVVPRMNIGGAETYVLLTALGLQRRGYQVVVVSWGGKLVEQLQQAGIHHYLFPVRLSACLTALYLQRIVQKHDIGLVHANSSAAGFAARRACHKLNLPFVYTAHGLFGHNDEELALGMADQVICVSKFLQTAVVEKGVSPERLITIYNGIDRTLFKPDRQASAAMRGQLGIEQQQFVIGIVSRIKNLAEKGHGDLVQLMERYGKQHNWKLVVIGKGRGLSKLQQEVKRRSLTEHFIFAGHQTDVSQMLQAVDVVVLPSQFETFGLVLIEAMAMEKPVITYAVGGTPEAVADGEAGYLVARGDVQAMYEKLNILDEQRDLIAQLGQHGAARVERLFDIEQMLDQLTAVYAQVIHSKAQVRSD